MSAWVRNIGESFSCLHGVFYVLFKPLTPLPKLDRQTKGLRESLGRDDETSSPETSITTTQEICEENCF